MVEFGAARRIGAGYYQELIQRRRPVVSGGLPEPAVSAPAQIRAEAFGIPRVLMGRRQISDPEWRSERSKEMFFLLLQHGRPMRKEQIAVELWPEVAQEQLNSAFHSTLYRLRRALDREIGVQREGGYAVNGTFDISYDAREFEEHMRAAQRAQPGSTDWAKELDAAVSLYRRAVRRALLLRVGARGPAWLRRPLHDLSGRLGRAGPSQT